jgi:hypothetical protein
MEVNTGHLGLSWNTFDLFFASGRVAPPATDNGLPAVPVNTILLLKQPWLANQVPPLINR